METLALDLLHETIKKRPENSHKGTFGRVLLIGGNRQYGGAIVMAATSCLYGGASLVSVATDKVNHAALHARLPEAMVIDWDDQTQLNEQIKQTDVLVIGPGMGVDSFEHTRLIEVLAQQAEHHVLIIDGSAITMLAKTEFTFNYPQQVIFTPHQKEWERLSGLSIDAQTIENNKQAQLKLNSVVVVKSHRTTIYTTAGDYLNPYGNPGMATGGTGDTLAGLIGSFVAQFKQISLPKRVSSAVLLHSYIGDQLAKENYVVLPTKLSEQLPQAMKFFSEK